MHELRNERYTEASSRPWPLTDRPESTSLAQSSLWVASPFPGCISANQATEMRIAHLTSGLDRGVT